MGELVIVRHGQTPNNEQRLFTGHMDVPLNQTGFEQAAQTAQQLKDEHFDVLICSPLLRARQTAEIINQFHHLPMILDEDFKEFRWGVLEGKSMIGENERYMNWWEVRDSELDIEPFESICERVYRGLDRLAERYGDKRVLLVAHGYVARIVYRYFCRPSEEAFRTYRIKNAEVGRYPLPRQV